MPLYIGLMSGTSLDGIDAALVEILPNTPPKLLDFLTIPLPETLSKQLQSLNLNQKIDLTTFCKLEKTVADVFSLAVRDLLKQSNQCAEKITAIGSHGQTIFHAPEIPMSLQIGHPAFIAKQTGIMTVADFRVDDMANQGQGAPLAPAFHAELFEAGDILINIGGISNLTYIGNTAQETFGFDTGPGNGLMDELCQSVLKQPHDPSGQIAKQAPLDQSLLKQLTAHPYFSEAAPKSTGRETFNLNWVNAHLTNQTPEVVLSTLNQLTADTITHAIQKLSHPFKRVLICGGGVHNLTLIQRIEDNLNRLKSEKISVFSTDKAGFHADGLEAMMCAWLAHQRITQTPIELQNITGANCASVLGGIFHP